MEICKKQEIESRDNGSLKSCEAFITSDKKLCIRSFDEEEGSEYLYSFSIAETKAVFRLFDNIIFLGGTLSRTAAEGEADDD